MRVYQKALKRLSAVESLLKSRFPRFGINKRQEIARLLYEIAKIHGLSPAKVIPRQIPRDFSSLKTYLLQERFPAVVFSHGGPWPYLPKFALNPEEFFIKREFKFSPKNIFVEKEVAKSSLSKKLKMLFPGAAFKEIPSLKAYRCANRGNDIKEYGRRQETVFLVGKVYGCCKPCPCTKGAVGCGYHIFNLGFGCIFECTYCYLQAYANSPGIVLPANIGYFFKAFEAYGKPGMRIGSGEFSDSLALDEVTEYSPPLIDFFRAKKKARFEFKTKSAVVKNVLKSRHGGNIVISWSLNPQGFIDNNEYYTASLKERLQAAAQCARAGYRVGFHFDPVVYGNGWEGQYRCLVESLFSTVRPKDIAWVSLGTFRLPAALKQVIERRFPQNSILDEELLLDFDGKLRYPFALRFSIYEKMIRMLRAHSKALNLYLCMEHTSMWKALRLARPRFG